MFINKQTRSLFCFQVIENNKKRNCCSTLDEDVLASSDFLIYFIKHSNIKYKHINYKEIVVISLKFEGLKLHTLSI
jgi:hypothetical protein